MDPTIQDSPVNLRHVIDKKLRKLEESARTLKLRRNALVPISRLPPEVLEPIFSFLFLPDKHERPTTGGKPDSLAWLRVSHVCHRWREIALNQPRFWSRINFNTLTFTGATQVLSRSKMAPLELTANLCKADFIWVTAFRKQLEANISRISQLDITANQYTLNGIFSAFVSPAPILESLSVIVEYVTPGGMSISASTSLPRSLFDYAVPRLSSLKLDQCKISWKSPLLKTLRTLELNNVYRRPSLEVWLDAMDQMTQLESLIAHSATPEAPPLGTTVSEPTRVITHPSLTQLHLVAPARDCAFALSHLELPSLKVVGIHANSEDSEGEDVLAVIPLFSRNAYGSQDVEPLQSVIITGEPFLTEVIAWTARDAGTVVQDPLDLIGAAYSARAIFTVTSSTWMIGAGTGILDEILAALPLNCLKTLTTQNSFILHEDIWLSHAPHWPLLDRLRLVDTGVILFFKVLLRDKPPEGPLLPALTKLDLLGMKFKDDAFSLLQSMLSVRVAQGVPLKALDLCACTMTDDAVRLLGEIVPDVQELDDDDWRVFGWPTLTNWINGDSDDSDEDEEDNSDDMSSDGDIDVEDEEDGLDE